MLQFLLFLFIFSTANCDDDDDDWKDFSYAIRVDNNFTIKSAHISWTDQFDDSFAIAFTDQNRTDLDFLFDKPTPELVVSNNFIHDSFSKFVDMFLNLTKIAKVRITMPKLTDDFKNIISRKVPKDGEKKQNVQYFMFNSYDTTLYSEFLRIIDNIPKKIRISFFYFPERTEKVLDGSILSHDKIRKVEELDMRTVESDVTDRQLLQLKCRSISIRSTTLTSEGINRLLKEWQDGIRPTRYLKVVADDLQKAEIMDGVVKRTLQRNVWQIKNRFNTSATVTVSRVPTNLYDAKPTFEFSVS